MSLCCWGHWEEACGGHSCSAPQRRAQGHGARRGAAGLLAAGLLLLGGHSASWTASNPRAAPGAAGGREGRARPAEEDTKAAAPLAWEASAARGGYQEEQTLGEKRLWRLRRYSADMPMEKLLWTIMNLRKDGLLNNFRDCEAALSALGKRRSKQVWVEAVAVLQDMKRQALVPSAKHLAAAANACRRGKQWELALSCYKQALQDGTLLSVELFSSVISACGEGQKWQLSLHLLGSMEEAAVTPNLFAYTAAISACENSRQWMIALELLGTCCDLELNPDVVAYSSAISACEKGQQFDLVEELLLDMWKQDVNPNIVTYNAVLRAFAQQGRWDRAMELFSLLQNDELQPDVQTCNAVMNACELGRKWYMCVATLKQMQKRKLAPDSSTYISIASACLHGKQWGFALKLLEEGQAVGLGPRMLEGMVERGQAPPKAVYLSAMLAVQEGQWEVMLSLFTGMRRWGYDPGRIGLHVVEEASRRCVSQAAAEKLRHVLATFARETEDDDRTFRASLMASAPGPVSERGSGR